MGVRELSQKKTNAVGTAATMASHRRAGARFFCPARSASPIFFVLGVSCHLATRLFTIKHRF
jgi:hypothetical protein